MVREKNRRDLFRVRPISRLMDIFPRMTETERTRDGKGVTRRAFCIDPKQRPAALYDETAYL
jgi:hypothetical protein